MTNLKPQTLISLHQISASQTRPPGAPSDLPQPVHLANIARGSNPNTINETLQVGSWEHLEKISTVTVTFV